MKKIAKTLCLTACTILMTGGLFAQTDGEIKTETFVETTKNVDVGGIAFSYLDISSVRELVADVVFAFTPSAQDNDFRQLTPMIIDLLDQSGLMEIQGYAASAVERKDGNFTVKNAIYAPEDNQKGLIWNLCGRAPHAPDAFKYLPASSIAAVSSDINGAGIFDAVTKNINQYGDEELKEKTNRFFKKFAKEMNIPFPDAARSIKSISCAVTNDGEKYMIPGVTGFTILIETDGDALFKAVYESVKKQIPQNVMQDSFVLEVQRSITMTVFQRGKYIAATTEPATIKALFEGKGSSLSELPEFKAYKKDIPQNGNAFGFVSTGLGRTINEMTRPNQN